MSEFDDIPLPQEDKKSKDISIKVRFAGVFSSLSFIIYTVIVLVNNFSIDKYFLIRLLTEILPASIILGILGYTIGKLIDESRR